MRSFTAAAVAAVAAAQTVPANTNTVDTRACQAPFSALPFCNTTLSLEERVADLVGRLQGPEIVPQLTARHNGGGSPGPGANVSRLGLPEWDFGLNALHGVQSSCVSQNGVTYCPTSFPNPVNFGMSWNQTAFLMLGQVVANETRALWLAGAVEDSDWAGRGHIGLDVWSPTININRDPRWGRNAEAPSEDPFINGVYGSLHTQGLQQGNGEDRRYLKTAVTLKHWDAYSLEDSDGFQRYNFNALITNFTLADTYWPAFKASVLDGNAQGIMCSYNAINGVPTCADSWLTQTVLRGTWGFNGYITSDSGAIEDIWQEQGHHYVPGGAEGACVAIRDGTTDVCSGGTYHTYLLDAVANGTCAMSDVQAALSRTFRLRMNLGLFDPIEDQPYWHMSLQDYIGRPEALESQWISTLEGQVLLKNTDSFLPLTPGMKVAVVGPHAKSQVDLAGNYLGQLCSDNTNNCIQTPLSAVQAANGAEAVQYAQGSQLSGNDQSGFPAAVAAAQASDVVLVYLGLNQSLETESHDRTSIDLPTIQHQLVAALAAAGKPMVLILINGGTVDISPELATTGTPGSLVKAILSAGYPGVLGGAGIAATVFGTNDRLGGRLPYTMYPASYVNLINMSMMEMDVGPGRSYRYYTGTPLLPFGYGLTFTDFDESTTVQAISHMPGKGAKVQALASGQKAVLRTEPAGWAMRKVGEAARPAAHGLSLSYSVNTTNVGSRTGDEVVQAYFEPTNVTQARASGNNLIQQLWAFQRVHLSPGQSQVVTFTATAGTFRMTHRGTGDIMSYPGMYTVHITNGVDLHMRHEVELVGEASVVEPFPAKPAPQQQARE